MAFSGWFLERKLSGNLEHLQERQVLPGTAIGALFYLAPLDSSYLQPLSDTLLRPPQAEHLREILTSLGPAFVKIGQVCCRAATCNAPSPA